MVTGGITVIEGEDTIRTVLSLQFVYRGSIQCGEYGCFISGTKILREVENIMNRYGISSEYMKDFPSIVLLDADKLGEIKFQENGIFAQLETVLALLKEIYKDIQFSRLAIDGFDLLSDECSRKDMEYLFNFARKNNINVILTVNLQQENSDLLDLCDNYIIVKKGCLPSVLFS